MELHVAITPDNPLYIIGWGVVLFMIFVPIFIGNNTSIRLRMNFEKGWAVLLLVSYLVMTTLSIFRGEASWATSLLCHMCGFSRLLAIGYLFTRKRWMGEMVTFMGIEVVFKALSSEFTHGLHPVYVFDYYFNHASIIAIGFISYLCTKNSSKKELGSELLDEFRFLLF